MKLLKLTLLAGASAVLATCASSCAGITGALTGQPIPATSVQRAGDPDSPVVQVASSDYALAEAAEPGTVHGLYDAGRVAQSLREVSGSK